MPFPTEWKNKIHVPNHQSVSYHEYKQTPVYIFSLAPMFLSVHSAESFVETGS
jgi:hypothetical protein